jgi:hypothetical protein
LARTILQRIVEEMTGNYIEPAKARWSRMTHKYLIEDAQIEPFVTFVANDITN